jgi:hypothetical protein
MAKRTTHDSILDGIESNIEATKGQIYQLKNQFASFVVNGETAERRLILQQLHILQDNLDLLRVRRIYALEAVN